MYLTQFLVCVLLLFVSCLFISVCRLCPRSCFAYSWQIQHEITEGLSKDKSSHWEFIFHVVLPAVNPTVFAQQVVTSTLAPVELGGFGGSMGISCGSACGMGGSGSRNWRSIKAMVVASAER